MTTIFFSAARGGFFSPEIHGGAMPPDAIEITQELHAELMEAQAAGLTIVADEDGLPVAQEPAPAGLPPVPSVVALWQFRRELQARGWWDDVQTAIAALPDSARDDVLEWLERGSEAERASPTLQALAAAIGVADEIDDAFASAAARVL